MSRLTFTRDELGPTRAYPEQSVHDIPDPIVDISVIERDFGRCQFTDEQLVAMIRYFVGNIWFSRIWTVQEMLLARQIRFICGSDVASLDTIWRGAGVVTLFSAFSNIWDDIRHDPKLAWPRMFFDESNSQRMRTIWNIRLHPTGPTAHGHRWRDATDPRDKIFGLLAISDTSMFGIHGRSIVADYSQAVEEVFTKVAVISLLETEGWRSFTFIGDSTQNRIPNLPSWVADYTQQSQWRPLQLILECKYQVTPSSQGQFRYNEDIPERLVVPYYEFDTVASVCPACWRVYESKNSEVVDLLNLLLSPSPVEPKGSDDIITMLVRTVTADEPAIDIRGHAFDASGQFLEIICCQLWLAVQKKSSTLAQRLLEGEVDPNLLTEALDSVEIRRPPDTLVNDMAKMMSGYRTEKDVSIGARGLETYPGDLSRYATHVGNSMQTAWGKWGADRTLFRTTRGHLGLGPRTAQPGDRVGILQGAKMPYIFRDKEGKEGAIKLVGESFVYGIMYGELEEEGSLEYIQAALY
ncbi:hypothetical protein B0T16DRAFT_449245 [Cercophora newfieldiana]|uniref:Heterokaryon incompatibility domain-containing protein n=1 Tax=Cercophora newfieldiana TaxID=92897 RepID=A0AA39XZM3_9PEZI|nr:hypothetical protein B0T16DRAFT_449245 [Cercophora newfieldiana]